MPATGPRPASPPPTRCVAKFGPKLRPLAERFWAKVRKAAEPDGCWLWFGGTNGAGYGMLYDRDTGRKELAHRVAWKLETGAYPERLLRHRCNTPGCVRFDHTLEGTVAENARDMMNSERGRNQYGVTVTKPDRLPTKQWPTPDEVRDIQTLWDTGRYTQTELARLYGFHQTTVSRIVRGVAHRHVR